LEYGLRYLKVGKRRTLATGEHKYMPFSKVFRVLCLSTTFNTLVDCLKAEGIGKVTLRFSVSPEEYWNIRNRIESELQGNEKGSLFKIGDTWIGAVNVT